MLSGVYLTSHALWCRPDEERNSLIVQFNTNENVHNAVKTSIKAIRSEDTFQKGEPRLKQLACIVFGVRFYYVSICFHRCYVKAACIHCKAPGQERWRINGQNRTQLTEQCCKYQNPKICSCGGSCYSVCFSTAVWLFGLFLSPAIFLGFQSLCYLRTRAIQSSNTTGRGKMNDTHHSGSIGDD